MAFNAAGCNIQGEIPSETFCDHTPDLRFVNLSHNPNYVFTSKPFECLEKLDALWIEGTTQNCDPDTVKWIKELAPDKIVEGDTCSSHPLPVSPAQGKFPTTQSHTLNLPVKLHQTISYLLLNYLLIKLLLLLLLLLLSNTIWILIETQCLTD